MAPFLFIYLLTYSNAFGFNSDTRSMALSHSNVAMNTGFNFSENLASMANSTFNGFSLTHQFNYFVKDLSISTLQFAHSINDNSFIQSSIDYSGNKNYNEINFQLSYGKKIGDKINGGISLQYHQQQFSDNNYSNFPSATATVYLFAKATDKIHFGCLVDNPTRVKLKNQQNLPSTIIGGISYLPTDKTKIALVAIQQNGNEMSYSVGIEYLFLKEFELRFSYQNKVESLAAGFSLLVKDYRIEFAFHTQQPIGNSSCFSLLIPMK
ncbi:MAG: TonB-dependent receptor [Bacteroidetes bacterium]|nr:TonB-dependent receptor [Bacteroidota bacterium]